MVTNKMSIRSRIEYLKKIKPRYLKGDKFEKSQMLDEFCQNTGYQRKYAIRRLAAACAISEPQVINRRRSCHYTHEDILWLARVWEVMDYPCGQRLAPALAEMIMVLTRHHELAIPETTVQRLNGISSDTIDKRLKPYRNKLRRKINSTTRPGSLIKKQIPIRTVSWDEQRIGCCELDLVAHCGASAAGDFISSLNLTDMLTGWTETTAVLGKAQSRIIAGLDKIKQRLPFTLTAIDPDNGSEFINWQLFNYCMTNEVEFTRGRPYQKNDNAHIEQKNWTHVRKLFGYCRLETEAELILMNGLYGNEWRLYKNFFIPNVKLIAKMRSGRHGEKIRKKYDVAKTPYQRVLECEQVSQEVKAGLKKLYDSLNPAALRRTIITKIDSLKRINNNQPAVVISTAPRVTFTNHLTKGSGLHS